LETSISLDALKIGGHNNLMMAFNEAIIKLGAIEILLSRQEFTWSNNNPYLRGWTGSSLTKLGLYSSLGQEPEQ
jgi:hypothetical protein